MKGIARIYLAMFMAVLAFTSTACYRSSNEIWEDSKSAGRHMKRGLRTIGGKYGDSRAIQYPEEFMPADNGYVPTDNGYVNEGGGYFEEFIPLSDQPPEMEASMADYVSRQPRETPGDPGSSIVSVEAFQDPSVNPTWAGVFRNITFDYNSNLVKGQYNLETLHNVAEYMRRNRNIYAFIEGHCDERGPEAYNLALGARRSNAVRNLLIQEGVSPDNIFTISYGKERPLFFDHNEESWSHNRRVEFKIYQR